MSRTIFFSNPSVLASDGKASRNSGVARTRFPSVHALSEFSHGQGHTRTKLAVVLRADFWSPCPSRADVRSIVPAAASGRLLSSIGCEKLLHLVDGENERGWALNLRLSSPSAKTFDGAHLQCVKERRQRILIAFQGSDQVAWAAATSRTRAPGRPPSPSCRSARPCRGAPEAGC
jgi:hypothetical protein